MTTMLKRRIEDREIETLAMANCLVLLSHMDKKNVTEGSRIYTCKTCERKFPSFQALGGHRASHKKPRLTNGDLTDRSPATKPIKAHGCPICGQEFALGQALGGHMRRHRAAVGQENYVGSTSDGIKTRTLSEIVTPILKRSSSSSKRVVCLDLNLTPFENVVKFGMKSTLPSWLIA